MREASTEDSQPLRLVVGSPLPDIPGMRASAVVKFDASRCFLVQNKRPGGDFCR